MEYALIGESLSHSYSREIHNKISNYSYELKSIKKDELPAFFNERKFKGLNVTIPYKEEVIKYLDFIDPLAESIGSVNTIVNDGGKLFGYNTDFFGFKSLILKSGFNLESKKVLILGSGGTAKTVCSVLKHLNAKETVFVSRSHGNGKILYDEVYDYLDFDFLINTTPVGMYPDFDMVNIALCKFKNLEGVIDVIYNPISSPLILEAKRLGIKCASGLFMLISQAVKSSELFLNTKFEDSFCEKIYKEIKSEKENIVLIGMPSCGKTTVGKMLSSDLKKKFIDTDEEISKSEGLTVPEIFNLKGEDYFRKKESGLIDNISQKGGFVIATGGGSILSDKNVLNLKRNGVLIFIDTHKEKLFASNDRPLSSSKEALDALYKKRIPIYENVCDYKVIPSDELKETIALIKEVLR